MRLLSCFIFLVSLLFKADAQDIIVRSMLDFDRPIPKKLPVRHLRSKIISKDSVMVFFDEEYNLVEDSCARIVRYGHFNRAKQYFTGKFTDVNKFNPSSIIATG